jgi:hypothetical protein
MRSTFPSNWCRSTISKVNTSHLHISRNSRLDRSHIWSARFRVVSWFNLNADELLKISHQPQEDDGLIIYESRAMARYIAAKAGSPLLPAKDPKAEALFEQAASVESANFDPYAYGLANEKVFGPQKGLETDELRIKKLQDILENKLEGYERILSKQNYLAGSKLTLADLFHLPYGAMLAQMGYDYLENPEKYPSVARYARVFSGSTICILFVD